MKYELTAIFEMEEEKQTEEFNTREEADAYASGLSIGVSNYGGNVDISNIHIGHII